MTAHAFTVTEILNPLEPTTSDTFIADLPATGAASYSPRRGPVAGRRRRRSSWAGRGFDGVIAADPCWDEWASIAA